MSSATLYRCDKCNPPKEFYSLTGYLMHKEATGH